MQHSLTVCANHDDAMIVRTAERQYWERLSALDAKQLHHLEYLRQFHEAKETKDNTVEPLIIDEWIEVDLPQLNEWIIDHTGQMNLTYEDYVIVNIDALDQQLSVFLASDDLTDHERNGLDNLQQWIGWLATRHNHLVALYQAY